MKPNPSPLLRPVLSLDMSERAQRKPELSRERVSEAGVARVAEDNVIRVTEGR